jgi:hypothetical protein
LVEEVLAVKRDQGFAVPLAEQRRNGRGGAEPGVDLPFERDHEHGFMEDRLAVHFEDLGQTPAVRAHDTDSRDSAAISKR